MKVRKITKSLKKRKKRRIGEYSFKSCDIVCYDIGSIESDNMVRAIVVMLKDGSIGEAMTVNICQNSHIKKKYHGILTIHGVPVYFNIKLVFSMYFK